MVFAAISGDAHALGELEVLWPTVAADLDDQLVEQSREQYLRCALSIWGECVASDGKRPERAVSAIDVLCVLFERVSAAGWRHFEPGYAPIISRKLSNR